MNFLTNKNRIFSMNKIKLLLFAGLLVSVGSISAMDSSYSSGDEPDTRKFIDLKKLCNEVYDLPTSARYSYNNNSSSNNNNDISRSTDAIKSDLKAVIKMYSTLKIKQNKNLKSAVQWGAIATGSLAASTVFKQGRIKKTLLTTAAVSAVHTYNLVYGSNPVSKAKFICNTASASYDRMPGSGWKNKCSHAITLFKNRHNKNNFDG
jgi:hypothetical protein